MKQIRVTLVLITLLTFSIMGALILFVLFNYNQSDNDISSNEFSSDLSSSQQDINACWETLSNSFQGTWSSELSTLPSIANIKFENESFEIFYLNADGELLNYGDSFGTWQYELEDNTLVLAFEKDELGVLEFEDNGQYSNVSKSDDNELKIEVQYSLLGESINNFECSVEKFYIDFFNVFLYKS